MGKVVICQMTHSFKTAPLQTFQAYFKERSATLAHYHSATGQLEVNITCGVQQGSVVGPTLWNVAYDRVLRAWCPESTKIIGFADDTLIMAWGKTTGKANKRGVRSGRRRDQHTRTVITDGEVRSRILQTAIQKKETLHQAERRGCTNNEDYEVSWTDSRRESDV